MRAKRTKTVDAEAILLVLLCIWMNHAIAKEHGLVHYNHPWRHHCILLLRNHHLTVSYYAQETCEVLL